MALGNRREIRIERRKMREEVATVDSSAVSASAAASTGLSSNTPNLLALRSTAEIIFTFTKNFTEAPNVFITAIGAHTAPAYIKAATLSASGFTVVTDTGAEDFCIRVLGSDKPSV